MAILNNSNAISTTGGYDINNSLRLRSSASAYLNRTPGSAGNRRTWTLSAWVKLGSLSSTKILFSACTAGDSTGLAGLQFTSSDTLQFFLDTGATGYGLITTQVFRDPSAWYHIVAVLDTTQATSTNRMKLYINGSQITAFGTATYPSLNDSYAVNNTQAHNIGRYTIDGTRYFDGYLAEVNLIDGQALTPSSFGETDTTTGSWKPKAYTGTYGTNGFYLKFSDIATTSGSNAGLGKDFSGNGNYWNTNNISVTAGTTYDAMIDSPTLTSATVANYCVMNPLDIIPGRTLPVISGANLDASNGGSGDDLAHGTIAVSSGKWYFEMVAGTVPGASTHFVGWQVPVPSPVNGGLYRSNGVIYDFSAATTSAPTYTANDIIGCVVDVDAGKVWFSKNGTYVNSGDPAAGTNPAYTFTAGSLITPALAFDNIASTCTASVNFGQRPFSYTPPTGFVRLNTYNLPDSTIKKGNTVMDATLYTGNLTGQSITNAAAFKPDLVWIKSRSAATDNKLTDSVRGATKALVSNSSAAETTDVTGMTAFNTNGFTVGASTTYNNTGATYVGWQWQAGQSSGSSNTSGTITSTVSVSTTAGFSVVTYTGTGANATVGHGLGVAPSMIVCKPRSAVDGWMSYHSELGNTKYILLNSTNAAAVGSGAWNNTSPTSSVFTIGTSGNVNTSGVTMVAYCWAEIAGFSAFGSYEGNASADGPMIYLGFRPKFVLIKRSSVAGNDWVIRDSSRDTYNTTNLNLYANLSDAEASGSVNIDFLSNGFKLRGSGVGANGSGTYIYMAFAENPFKNSLAR